MQCPDQFGLVDLVAETIGGGEIVLAESGVGLAAERHRVTDLVGRL